MSDIGIESIGTMPHLAALNHDEVADDILAQPPTQQMYKSGPVKTEPVQEPPAMSMALPNFQIPNMPSTQHCPVKAETHWPPMPLPNTPLPPMNETAPTLPNFPFLPNMPNMPGMPNLNHLMGGNGIKSELPNLMSGLMGGMKSESNGMDMMTMMMSNPIALQMMAQMGADPQGFNAFASMLQACGDPNPKKFFKKMGIRLKPRKAPKTIDLTQVNTEGKMVYKHPSALTQRELLEAFRELKKADARIPLRLKKGKLNETVASQQARLKILWDVRGVEYAEPKPKVPRRAQIFPGEPQPIYMNAPAGVTEGEVVQVLLPNRTWYKGVVVKEVHEKSVLVVDPKTDSTVAHRQVFSFESRCVKPLDINKYTMDGFPAKFGFISKYMDSTEEDARETDSLINVVRRVMEEKARKKKEDKAAKLASIKEIEKGLTKVGDKRLNEEEIGNAAKRVNI